MSDFLNQFSNDKYETSEKVKPVEEVKHSGISSTEHETEIDETFHKRSIIRYGIIAATVIISILIIFLGIRLSNQVPVKDFVGTRIEEAKTWALKNKVELDIKEEYSLEKNEGLIISQNVDANKKVQKKSILNLVVSKGPDPEEKITLPDFKTMTYAQIRTWIEENKATGVTTTLEYNNEVEKNKFIRMEFKDQAISEENFKRKDRLTIYISRGSETAEKNITIPDFKGKSKSEAENWGATNDITIVYEEAGSETIVEGAIISQNIATGQKLAKKDSITLTISLGKGALVPNFWNLSKEEATTAGGMELVVTVKTKYSETVPYGELIYQDVSPGRILYRDKTVEVCYSEGRPFIDSLIGKSEKDLPQYFYSFSSKGANVTYETEYVDSYEEKGTVVEADKGNEFIPLTTHVKIKVSKGNLPNPITP